MQSEQRTRQPSKLCELSDVGNGGELKAVRAPSLDYRRVTAGRDLTGVRVPIYIINEPRAGYRFGAEEWEDLEAAGTFALAAGAEDVILVGYSMGGAIVASFLYNSEAASSARGVILDSPALNLDEIIDFRGTQERVFGLPLPGPLTGLAKLLTTLRFGVDFNAMNHLDHADELSPSTPILLFHGSDDTSVPVSLSEELAEARPDIVEYHVFSDASHVGSWNLDSERYEAVVHAFLARLD